MKKFPSVLVLLLLVLIAAIPFVNIWAVNTLFGTGIGYTWSTWFASLILSALVSGNAAKVKMNG